MRHKIGDIVNIDDVNAIKNELYDEAFRKSSEGYESKKKEIRKRVKFVIISL